jgi:uncharacterized protein
MPRKRDIRLRCPTCKKPVKKPAPDLPFCSERCRLIDLGNWASGKYVVSSPITDAEEIVRTERLKDLIKKDSLKDEDGE